MDLLRLVVPGDPVPKGRPRTARGQVYTPARTREAELAIRQLADLAYRHAPYTGPVGVEIRFYCATRRRVDGDNLSKLVTDALQRGRRASGGVILDDSQIVEWHCWLYRRPEGQEPRTEIRLFTLGG